MFSVKLRDIYATLILISRTSVIIGISAKGASNMFGIFKPDPVRKLTQQYESLLQQAMQAQRTGDIKLYSELTDKAESVGAELDKLRKQE